MPFPFGGHAPEKDSKKIYFTFVEIRSQQSKEQLFEFLKTLKKKPMSDSMITDGLMNTIAIPLRENDHTFGYAGIHVRAEQTHHGAITFHSVGAFIQETKV